MTAHGLLRIFFRFLLIAVIVIGISLTTTYVILKRNVDNRIAQLDKATRLIAGQINSANLNSILGFTNDYFIFIIHRRDGRVLFESAKRPPEQQKIWELAKAAVLKEMMASSDGQLVYPQTKRLKILIPEKTVRYLTIAELDWIIGVELPANVPIKQLVQSYPMVVWTGIFCFSFIISLCFPVKSDKEKAEEESPPQETVQRRPAEAVTQFNAEYSKRLIAEAKKQLEQPEKKPAIQPVQEIKQNVKEIIETAPAPKPSPVVNTSVDVTAQKISMEIKLPLEIKPEKPVEILKDETKKTEEKVVSNKPQTEMYFNKLLENKKSKLEPSSIIGMALTKKNNREKLDT